MTKTTNGRPTNRARFTPKTDAQRESELADLKETLANGVAAIKNSEDWKRYLRLAARFHTYSLNNVILVMIQCDARGMKPPTRLASFKKWQEFKRNVSKGQKGLKIFAPIIVKVKPGDKEYDPTREKTRLAGFRVTVTFDYQQTEDEPLPERSEIIYPDGEIPAGMWDSAVRYAASLGFSVSIGETGRADGFTDHISKRIVVSAKLKNVARETTTLIHEIGHAVLHAPADYDYAANRGEAETEAESVAFIVGTYFGIDTGTESFAYVGGWVPDAATLSKVGTRIMRTVREIIAAIEPDIVTGDVPAPVPAETGTDEALMLF